MEHETEPAEPVQAEAVQAEAVQAEAVQAEAVLAESGLAGTGPAGSEQRAGGFPDTGEPRVDAALQLLDRLPELPVADHPELFERVHAQLTDVLGELDSGAGGAAGPPAS